MKKRRRWLSVTLASLSGITLAALGLWWWRATTPNWNLAYVPWGDENALPSAYGIALMNPQVAKEVGYGPAQLKADQEKSALAMVDSNRIDAQTQAMQKAKIASEQISAFRRKNLPAAKEAYEQIAKDLPTLNEAQKKLILTKIVRQAGIWILGDRRVSRMVGLSEPQRSEVQATSERLRWYYNDEQDAWNRTRYLFEGASALAVTALGEQRRQSQKFANLNIDGSDPIFQEESTALSNRTMFSPKRSMPRWLDTMHFDLLVRRLVGFRREEETRLLSTLTEDQLRRWEALKSGKEPG